MTVQISNIRKTYEDLSVALQGISLNMRSNPLFNSKDVAKVMRYAQRCGTDGELGKDTAPNVRNVCAKIKKFGKDMFDVECKRIVTLREKSTGITFLYEIEEDLQDES